MNDWTADMATMHSKYGVREWIAANPDKLSEFLKFRMNFIIEELEETQKAIAENDPEEIVDGLIDLCVVALGTLDAFGVDAGKAWDQVHEANMAKNVGVKPTRPNKLGLPDLIKPEGWVAPDHTGNYGDLVKL
tara:strand:- start:23158 stop:23556 length:399 start_codon:yes stop_codon:yes gene_type:complete